MSARYIICSLYNDWDTFVAVIKLTPTYQKILRERMDLAASMKKNDLAWLQYFDYIDVYENSYPIEEWIDKNANTDEFERNLKIFSNKEPDYIGWERARVDVSYLQVDDQNCCWNIRLKHDEYILETQPISREELGLSKE